MEKGRSKTILWWGRFDPDYSRNRILRKLLRSDGWIINDFHPKFCSLGDIQASWTNLARPDLIWVPCFRQHDLAAAGRTARKLNIPLIFDPLISAYDKQVFERQKFTSTSRRAARLRRWESRLFQRPNIVLADTSAHSHFFVETLGVDSDKVFVVPVGAEETLFVPQPPVVSRPRLEVLFYGSFVQLQGVDVIVEAARMVPEVDWTLLGQGKLRAACEESAKGLSHVRFEDWVPYEQLAARIGRTDILLGIFGDTLKASRVIPNKFYQAIACARPVITLDSPVYGAEVRSENEGGIAWVPPADPSALAHVVKEWVAAPDQLSQRGANARKLYERFYANDQVRAALRVALSQFAGL